MRQLRAMLASLSAIVDQVEALQVQLESLDASELAGEWTNHRGGAGVRAEERRAAAEVLGCSPDATPDEVHAAWRARARLWHPDAPTGNAWAFQQASEARAVLLGQK